MLSSRSPLAFKPAGAPASSSQRTSLVTSRAVQTAPGPLATTKKHGLTLASHRAVPPTRRTLTSKRSEAVRGRDGTRIVVSASSGNNMTTEVCTIGGGCFWCLDACYRQMKGVLKVESGYAGGQVENPTYKQICTGTTGHAEVVQITFDPSVVSFKELLEVFFTIHDPTTKDRQGNDVGTQYRSVIFYHDDAQKAVAEEVMARVTAEEWWGNSKLPLIGSMLPKSPLVTELSPLPTYYPAEKYHQDYYNQNPNQGYCMAVVAPKVAKMRGKFMSKLIK